jgi:hypothetical protein
MNTPIPAEILRRLSREETVLWHGRPRQGFPLGETDVLFIPIAIVCVILFSLNLARSSQSNATDAWIPFIPLSFLSTCVLGGRLFFDHNRRERTYYALTQRRVLIIKGSGLEDVDSLPLCQLKDISYADGVDKSGTITFGIPDYSYVRSPHYLRQAQEPVPHFELIDDARQVFWLIQNARQREAKAATARPPRCC